MITAKQINNILEDSVAQTILRQLGGNGFISATGARDILSSGNSLSLKFPKVLKDGANYLVVSLQPNDSYNMDFGQLRGNDVKRVELKTNIDANGLRKTFSDVTGIVLNIF